MCMYIHASVHIIYSNKPAKHIYIYGFVSVHIFIHIHTYTYRYTNTHKHLTGGGRHHPNDQHARLETLAACGAAVVLAGWFVGGCCAIKRRLGPGVVDCNCCHRLFVDPLTVCKQLSVTQQRVHQRPHDSAVSTEHRLGPGNVNRNCCHQIASRLLNCLQHDCPRHKHKCTCGPLKRLLATGLLLWWLCEYSKPGHASTVIKQVSVTRQLVHMRPTQASASVFLQASGPRIALLARHSPRLGRLSSASTGSYDCVGLHLSDARSTVVLGLQVIACTCQMLGRLSCWVCLDW